MHTRIEYSNGYFRDINIFVTTLFLLYLIVVPLSISCYFCRNLGSRLVQTRSKNAGLGSDKR